MHGMSSAACMKDKPNRGRYNGVDMALEKACETFDISELFPEQRKAIYPSFPGRTLAITATSIGDDQKRTKAALQGPLHQRCEEINKVIEESSTKELHSFFPNLLGSVFGYDSGLDWGLRTLPRNTKEFEVLRIFLGPHGPMFRLIGKLQVDGYLKYEFFIQCLPLPSQSSLSEGVIPALYHNKMQSPGAIHTSSTGGYSTGGYSARVILLNAFEYYMFHFAYYVIYQQTHRVQDPSWMNGTETPYMVILEDYLNHFLPSAGSPVISSSPHSTSSSTTLARKTTWRSGSAYGRVSNIQTHFTGLIRAPSTGHMTQTAQGHSAYDHSSQETWRSETFLQILIEFWLNQNTMDSVTSNVLSHGQYFMPSVDLVKVIRMLIKQVHSFVHTTGIEVHSQPVISQTDELKRNVIPQMLQKKLYCFLRHSFAHWPLDPSFRVVIETWLSYIQPWRYAKQALQNRDEGADAFGPEWSVFVSENFLFYVALLREFVLRALKLDLYSVKDAFILLRVSKVLSQVNLMDVIEEGEKLIMVPSGGPKGPLRTSSSSIGVSLASTLRAHLLDLEGPSYLYTPIFRRPGIDKLVELRRLVLSALAEIRNPHPGHSGQHQHTSAQGPASWFKSLFSGEFLSDDYSSKSEHDKLIIHLEQALDNLTRIVRVSVDVTDAGDATIPWATPSPASGRQMTTAHSSPVLQGAMPECVETERGLVLTDRGKYQVITGLRRAEIAYTGDPELQPIRSFEIAMVVRSLYKLSTYLNEKLGDTLHHVYNTPGPVGNVACSLSPSIKITPTHNALGTSPVTSVQPPLGARNPRISLRFLASYKTLFYLTMLYVLCWLFSFGSLTVFVLFVLVLFISILVNVAPVFEKRELQKKLF